MKRVSKYIGISFSIVLIMLIGLLMYTQTASFRELVRVQSLKLVNPYFNGELNVGRIDGNLYNQIHLGEVTLIEQDSTVASIDSLSIHYNLEGVFKKHVVVDSLLIHALEFNLWYTDSTTLHLLYVLDKLTSRSREDSRSSFPLTLEVNNILIEGNGKYQFGFGNITTQFTGLSIEADGLFKNEHVEVDLKKLRFKSEEPDLEVENANVYFLKQKNDVLIDSLYLKTNNSLLYGHAKAESKQKFEIDLQAHPLNSSELRELLPELSLLIDPMLDISVQSENNRLSCNILASHSGKQIRMNGSFNDLLKAARDSMQKSAFDIDLNFINFVPEQWLDIKQTDANINGFVSIEGADLFNYEEDMDVIARLNKSYYRGVIADTISLEGNQTENTITADVLIVYNNSHSEGHFAIADLYHKPVYSANFMTRNLDLEAIEPGLKNSVVNGQIFVSGTHILSGERHFTTKAKLFDSKVFDRSVDSVVLKSDVKGTLLKVDTLIVEALGARVQSTGIYDFVSSEFETQLTAESDQSAILNNLGYHQFSFDSTRLKMNLSGKPKAFNYNGGVDVYKAGYQSNIVDSVSLVMEGWFQPDSLTSKGNLLLRSLNTKYQAMDSISIDYSYAKNKLQTELYIDHHDSINGYLSSQVHVADTINIMINDAFLKYQYASYFLTETNPEINIADHAISISGLTIMDHYNENFLLKLSGGLSSDSIQDLELDVKDLPLVRANRFMDLPDSINGYFSTTIDVSGAHDSIWVKGNYAVRQPAYGALAFPDIDGNIELQNDTLKVDMLLPQLDSSVYANASIDFSIEIDTIKGFQYAFTDSINAKVVFDSLLISTPEIEGYIGAKQGAELNGQIEISGLISQPQFDGNVNISDGYANNLKRGVYYSNILSHITLDGSKVMIDTLYIEADNGYFAAEGTVEFDSSLVSGKIVSSDVTTNINRFRVLQHKDLDVVISGNPYYKAHEDGEPLFGGEIRINRSTINLPEVIEATDKEDHSANTPLLIAAINKNDTLLKVKEDKGPKSTSLMMDQLKGRLRVDIQRNTWLKSDDMNIEIGGDFDIAKTGEYFELFGDVEILRGYYILYGRKFTVQEGLINFVGGEEPDPRLDIKAEYIFRGSDKEKRTLQLSVSEFLSEPTIGFTLDGETIPESDAVSIMVFGRTMDELSYDGQNGIVGAVGSNMLANMVSSSLNSTIGKRFKLDMIEVNSTENWQSAAFVVGKYITNDLFVIYQRGFGETEDDEITPETITLEYELNKIIFFRLQGGSSKTSGFDVILKFESSK